MDQLPVLAAQPAASSEHRAGGSERADAVRNRGRILRAAELLLARDGACATSIQDIATAAGVGKGTVFRRFGDRASLLLAVLDRNERDFQEAFLHGPPPLGPGAPARERLIAFGEAMLDHLDAHGELMLEIERRQAPIWQRCAPYAVWRLHVLTLLEQACPDAPIDYLADALLALLGPATFHHQRHIRGLSVKELKAGFADLVWRLLG